LFDGKDQNNAALDPLTVPTDYRVGPGDELLIRAWGQIDIDYQGPIDRSGRVFLPKIGQVMVAGQKLSDLRNLVATLIGKQYKQFELTVTLGALRQIQFYVAGFVRQPGIHTTESTATALHGLLSAGGPLPSGDLRHIEVRRGNQVVNVIDAYDFLANGDKSADPALQPGDILYVPAAQGFAAVAGSVRRPAIYHLKTPSTVADLLQLGGGQSFSQTQLTARLERLREGKRQVETLTLDAQQLQRPLQDGDLLIVLPPTPQFDQVVTLRGNVAEPLRQNWHAGMRVSDLIQNNTALVRFSTWIRQNSRNSLLNMFDSSRDTDFRRDFPDVNWDYASIERLDPATLSSQLLTFNLAKALEKDPQHDLTLQSGDTIVVFSKNDFRQPQNKKLRTVKLEGEVNAPGIYPAAPGETMLDLIQKAGGLTPQAFVFGIAFSRESARKEEAQRYQEVADRIEQDYLRYLAGRTKNAMSQEEGVIGSGEIEVVKALVTRLRSLQPDGRIALNLGGPNAGLQDLPNINLEDQDTLLIPSKPSTVTVVGSVMKQGSLFWHANWNAQDYIDNAGGLHAQANRSGIVIFRADGTVRKNATWVLRDALNPGDTIVVPEDVSSVSWSRLFRDWSQIFYQLALGGAALKVLRSGL
jgi:protein involved in polysaccharide export with SLBB domain